MRNWCLLMHILRVDFNVSLESVGWVSLLKRFSRLPTEMNRTKEAPCTVVHFFSRQSPREMAKMMPSPRSVDNGGAQKEANIPRWICRKELLSPDDGGALQCDCSSTWLATNVVSKTWQENHRGSSRRSAVKRRQGLWSVGKFSSIMGLHWC